MYLISVRQILSRARRFQKSWVIPESPLKLFTGTAGAPARKSAARRDDLAKCLTAFCSRYALIAGEGARGPSEELERWDSC